MNQFPARYAMNIGPGYSHIVIIVLVIELRVITTLFCFSAIIPCFIMLVVAIIIILYSFPTGLFFIRVMTVIARLTTAMMGINITTMQG